MPLHHRAYRSVFRARGLDLEWNVFMGLVGVLFMPLVGAAIGEFIARKNSSRAMKVGVATWLGLMAGMLAKVVLAFMMVGVLVVALLV